MLIKIGLFHPLLQIFAWNISHLEQFETGGLVATAFRLPFTVQPYESPGKSQLNGLHHLLFWGDNGYLFAEHKKLTKDIHWNSVTCVCGGMSKSKYR
jgi:ABC-type sulfate transport system permease subunit